jgi:uncharacterized protein (DUF983 family)
MRLSTVLWRSLRLRCPVCGRGKLFRGWFSMYDSCSECGLKFQRESGYWLGSIYFNYGLTALLVTVGYLGLWFADLVSPETLAAILAVFALVFPLWFFRYARSLWIGFDHLMDPIDRAGTQTTTKRNEN